jgi:hypothetical protein
MLLLLMRKRMQWSEPSVKLTVHHLMSISLNCMPLALQVGFEVDYQFPFADAVPYSW